MSETAAAGPLVIKRYPNRKLYDTGAKRYITLDQIENRVREGADVGTRPTFADVAATLAEAFEVRAPRVGASFLREVRA